MGLTSDIKCGKHKKAAEYLSKLSQEDTNKLKRGINGLDKKGYGLVHHFVHTKEPSIKLLESLQSLGADINLKSKYDKTPLDLVIEQGTSRKTSEKSKPVFLDDVALSKVVILLKHGAEIRSEHSAKLIHSAIESNNPRYLSVILEQHNLNVNAKLEHSAVLPLHRALQKTPANPEIVKLLLDKNTLLADKFNNPSELPKFDAPILEMVAQKSQEHIDALAKNHQNSAIYYTELKDGHKYSVKTILKNHTLCEFSGGIPLKLSMDGCYNHLLSFGEDYFTQLLMTSLALSKLDGLTTYVANAPSVFPLYAGNVFRGAFGYFMEEGNQILIGGIGSPEEIASTVVHEGLHAILTKTPKTLAHMCKPYAHHDKTSKQAYMSAIEQARQLIKESTLPSISVGKQFVEKTVFDAVDAPDSSYCKHSQKLQEYVARTVEAHLYCLQHPEAAKDVREVLSPLLDYLNNHVTKILEHYVGNHPQLGKIRLPEVVAARLPALTKVPETPEKEMVVDGQTIDLVTLMGRLSATGISPVTTARKIDVPAPTFASKVGSPQLSSVTRFMQQSELSNNKSSVGL